eukprot:jgi/Mesen1/6977/ME000361S06121
MSGRKSKLSSSRRQRKKQVAKARAEELATGGDDGGSIGRRGGGEGGGEGGDGMNDGDAAKNRTEALAAIAALGHTLESLPSDLASAVSAGRIPASIINRYYAMLKSPFFSYLMKFGGFKERLLADDLFLTKVAIETGVGVFTKTAAEYEKRRENFTKELDFVFADIAMAIVADFMLVWLPAPTVALRPSLTTGANAISKFFFNCPDNAFQVALRGTSYSLVQRFGAIARNGAKLLVVGTTASLLGTGATNGLIEARKALDSTYAVAPESSGVPIIKTSLAYGAYMAVSSNLRWAVAPVSRDTNGLVTP